MTDKETGATIEEFMELRLTLIIAMAKMAGQGSVPAASTAMKIMNEVEQLECAKRHESTLKELSKKPVELCKYLGRIGESKRDLQRHLGRFATADEEVAWKEGAQDRRLEIQAIELDTVKRGGKVEEWMKR